MTCQEVMDFMQRQLDGDLSENEAEMLTAHTRHCSDCADMFDRLKRLSTELESLPKVVPAFSIVDSIMPQLDQIELAAVNHNDSEVKAEVAEPAARRAPRRREGSWFKRVSWPAVSGVVAAGIVAGLFLVMYNPIQPSMDEKSDTATTESPSATSASEPVSKASIKDNNGDFISQESMQKKDGTEVRTESPSSAGGSDEGTGYRPLSGNQQDYGSGQAVGKTDVSETDKIERVTPYLENSLPQEKGLAGYEDAPLAPSADETTSEQKSVATIAKDQYGQAMSIMDNGTASTAPVSNVTNSPDGVYASAIMEGAVYIYTVQEGTVMYEGTKQSGETSNLSWSDDSKALFFEVKDAAGQTTHYKVDVATWSVTKV
ncbi:anti-sigma factor family protein [Paenibacillus sp. MMS18-CY102]|uniref:anti-sigma factor family protein n=1 Tax=Paenibacillus sp. MMS18-CY102 TaxID=2682849 RepID=UPI00136627EB|nr:zf-HC2 domain-containing protein [Paenibacillus sp. MMS18-CY102]MWC27539.1 hypothetical protein [Paenibacillus sp. MMS18-CY102]